MALKKRKRRIRQKRRRISSRRREDGRNIICPKSWIQCLSYLREEAKPISPVIFTSPPPPPSPPMNFPHLLLSSILSLSPFCFSHSSHKPLHVLFLTTFLSFRSFLLQIFTSLLFLLYMYPHISISLVSIFSLTIFPLLSSRHTLYYPFSFFPSLLSFPYPSSTLF